MSKAIRISDDIYDEISVWAEAEMRSVSNATDYLLKKGLSSVSPGIVESSFVVAGQSTVDCCLKKKPCKHWQWDINKELWVNTRAGEERKAE